MRALVRLMLCTVAVGSLSACGKDFNGFGEYDAGFSGYTKEFGNVDEGYWHKEVGLCTYTGGCLPDGSTSGGFYGVGPPHQDAGSGAVDNGGVGE